jgi:hypothetical protein
MHVGPDFSKAFELVFEAENRVGLFGHGSRHIVECAAERVVCRQGQASSQLQVFS